MKPNPTSTILKLIKVSLCISLLLGACNKDEDEPIEVPHAQVAWTITENAGNYTLSTLPGAGYIQYYANENQNLGMNFWLASTSTYDYINPDPDPDPFDPLIITESIYEFSLSLDKQSVNSFSLDPSNTTLENAEITIKIGGGENAPVYLESESGTVDIEKYEFINITSFKCIGTFTGVFHVRNQPTNEYHINGSWDVFY